MKLAVLLATSLLLQTNAKKAKEHKHRAKKLQHKEKLKNPILKKYKSLDIRAFGPKHKGQLCNTLTSAVVSFDVDGSGGLDWAEFQVFNTAIVDVINDHVSNGELH